MKKSCSGGEKLIFTMEQVLVFYKKWCNSSNIPFGNFRYFFRTWTIEKIAAASTKTFTIQIVPVLQQQTPCCYTEQAKNNLEWSNCQ